MQGIQAKKAAKKLKRSPQLDLGLMITASPVVLNPIRQELDYMGPYLPDHEDPTQEGLEAPV